MTGKFGRPFGPLDVLKRHGSDGDKVQITVRVSNRAYNRIRAISETRGISYGKVIDDLVGGRYGAR